MYAWIALVFFDYSLKGASDNYSGRSLVTDHWSLVTILYSLPYILRNDPEILVASSGKVDNYYVLLLHP